MSNFRKHLSQFVPVTLLIAAALAPVRSLAQHDHHANTSSEHSDKSVTLRGEIIDMGCFLGHQSKGSAHAKCALQCAHKGMPIGLLTADGTLYLLTMDHADAKPFNDAKAKAGQTMTITGEVHDAAGMKSLEVKKITA
jgi:hypothetical protein